MKPQDNSKKPISPGTSLRNDLRQFGSSICPTVSASWISAAVLAICAKAWGNRWAPWRCCRHRYFKRSNSLCNRRKAPTQLSYAVGDATEVNQADASFDVVVCTQVAEYVPDVDRVFSEAFRVLNPGGRTVFVATDWDAVVWHSEDPERMALVMKLWEEHCAHPHLPRSMAYRLIHAGFRFDGAAVFPILNLKCDDDSYSKGLAQIIRDFVARKKDISADDLNEWHGEFERLSDAGRYFFGINRYIFKASKPAAHTS